MKAVDARAAFFNYLRQQIDVVESIKGTNPETDHRNEGNYLIPTHRKILAVSMLDFLSGIRFPPDRYPALSKEVGKRFQRFVRECCGWANAGLVSVPILRRRGASKSLPRELARFLDERISTIFPPGDGGCLDYEKLDVSPSEVLSFVSTEQHEDLVELCRHYRLVYSMRNYLVHQVRSPGGAMDAIGRESETPCYHRYMGRDDLHLLYPFGFLKALFLRSLDSLEKHLRRFSINPYDLIEDSSAW